MACAVLAGVAASFGDRPRDLWFIISPRDTQILQVSDAYRNVYLGSVAMPIVANPDLGKLSVVKRAMIVDLGWLGDPLLARISSQRPDLQTLFLNDVAKPDVVETHDVWSCRYQGWLSSPAYRSDYQLSDPSWATTGPVVDASCPLGARYAIWQRTPDPQETALTRDLATSADPATLVRQATRDCAARPAESAFRCEKVRRAITRNTADLSQRGLLQQTINAMSASPTYAMDQHILKREPGWAEAAYQQFVSLTKG